MVVFGILQTARSGLDHGLDQSALTIVGADVQASLHALLPSHMASLNGDRCSCGSKCHMLPRLPLRHAKHLEDPRRCRQLLCSKAVRIIPPAS